MEGKARGQFVRADGKRRGQFVRADGKRRGQFVRSEGQLVRSGESGDGRRVTEPKFHGK